MNLSQISAERGWRHAGRDFSFHRSLPIVLTANCFTISIYFDTLPWEFSVEVRVLTLKLAHNERALLNSSHASSRDIKHASERDFRGGGLATRHTQIFIFIEFSL